MRTEAFRTSPAAWVVPVLVASQIGIACASGRGTSPDLPPYTFSIAVPGDSAMRVLRGALEAEHVTVEPAAVDGARLVRASFVVRAGGLGETEVFVTGRVSGEEAVTPASRIELDVSVRERRRPIVMNPAEVRTGATRPEMTTVNPNDGETIGRLSRICERLTRAGAARAGRATGS